MSQPKIRIFLADDHGIVRSGLRSLIQAESDMVVVGEAENGDQAFEAIRSLTPDVVLLDLSMPGRNGADFVKELHQSYSLVRVIVVTMQEEVGYVRRLVQAGALGYVHKRAVGDVLITAVRTVAEGGIFVDPRLTAGLISDIVAQGGSGSPQVSLSEREDEVLRSVAMGYTNKEIALKLSLSPKTVETYKARSMEKLGLRNRVDVVQFARDSGWFLKS